MDSDLNCHKLTARDRDSHSAFLNDGAYPGEGGVAAVILATVILEGIREVQVAVKAHGDPLILLNVLETCRWSI